MDDATSNPEWMTNPAGQRAVDFLSRLSLGGDFTGRPFVLAPFQEKIVRQVFGDLNEDGTRKITDVFIFLPRGQGKTEFIAAVNVYILFGEGKKKRGQELYSAAADKDQAARTYMAMAGMCRRNPTLSKLAECSDYHKRIKVPHLNNLYAALASDGFRRHSLAPSVVTADELHAWKGTELWDALTSGLSKRQEPLTFVTTTSGGDLNGLCYRYYEYAKSVRDGKDVNPSYLPVIYQADQEDIEGDGWTRESTWRKAMPALGTFSNLAVIRKQCELAKVMKSEYIKFLRYNLNCWIEDTAGGWLDVDRWDDLVAPVFPDFTGEDVEVVGALDLSTTTDISAFVVIKRHADLYYIKPYFWIPSETARVREKSEKLPYTEWVEQGQVEVTEGDAVDYPYLAKRIEEICNEHRVGKIAVDRFNSTHTAQQLRTNLGIEVFDHGQGVVSMDGPSKAFEWLLLTGKLRHDGNPLMRQMVMNCCIKVDEHEMQKPVKPKKSSKRIDGVVSAIMAIGLLQVEQGQAGFFAL